MPSYALIAEAEPAQAQLYRHIATAEGFEVRHVRDGEQALQALRVFGAPGLTILEPSLARADGFQVIRELRRMAGADQSPVVVISAFRALREAAQDLRPELGISMVLPRNAPVEQVQRGIKKVLAASAAPHGPAPVSAPPPPPATVIALDEERAEEIRLHRLDQMHLVDNGPQDEMLRKLAGETAARFGAPMAMISLVLEDRQFALAHHGLTGPLLEGRGSPRDESFCTHVVQGRSPLIVPDGLSHAVFSHHPLVQGGLVRAYAGAPLETTSGDVIGALAVLDTRPLAISAEQVDELVLMARRVSGELELRAARLRQERERAVLKPELQEQIRKDESLFSAMSYLSAMLDSIDNGVVLLDKKGEVAFANQSFADLFMTTTEALVGRHRDEIMREGASLSSDADEFLRRMRVMPDAPFALRGEFEMERPRRRNVRWTSKPVQLGDGVGHLVVLADITAERDLQHEREQFSRTDLVTGLMNRRGGEDVLEREAARAQRFGSRVSVALFDLDHFKQLNDRHGQLAGDEALRAVGQMMGAAMRGVDVAARWGADELLGILPATGLEGARSFAERVRASVERLDPRIMHGVTLSVGVAELQPGEDWADAVRRADAKLDEAKDAGRNRVA